MGNTQSGVLRLEEVEHIFLKVGRHHGCEPGSTLVTADYTSANAVAQEFVSSMSSKVSVI